MQTANPVLSNKTFDAFSGFASPETTMTVGGTVNKTGGLLACVLATRHGRGAVSPRPIQPRQCRI